MHAPPRTFGDPTNWERLRAPHTLPGAAANTTATIETGSNLVAVAGDWHGSRFWAADRIADAATAGARVLLHAGDFGIRSDKLGKRYVRHLEKACTAAGITLYVTPGNHEDWGRLTIRTSAPAPTPATCGGSAGAGSSPSCHADTS